MWHRNLSVVDLDDSLQKPYLDFMYCMNKDQNKLICTNVILVAKLYQKTCANFGDKIFRLTIILTNIISLYCAHLIEFVHIMHKI
jgi:hypothetical protein